MTTTLTAEVRELIGHASRPNIETSSRANRARVAVETLTDLTDLAAASRPILAGKIADLATLRQRPGSADPAAREAVRADLEALTRDFPLVMVQSIADVVPSGFTAAYLTRTYAAPMGTNERSSVPGIPDAVEGVVNPDTSTGGTFGAGPVVVEDVAPVRPDTAGASFAVSLMMLEVLDDNGRAILDQLAVDLVDRAAEKHIGAAIVAAAGGTRAAGSDLAAALDTAEAACGAGVESAADVLLVNPADWPKVRRAAAPSWQLGPHPEVGLSIGVPAGTVAFLSRAAVFAQIGRLQYASAGLSVQDASKHALNPAEFAANIGMFRHFRTIIRRPAGIQLVTL
jgi:hypothetical protein